MKKQLFVFLACLICGTNFSQKEGLRNYVDTLTSNYFSGRGYVNNGHLKTAAFLSNEFKRLKLSPVSDSYFQEFHINVNTFPSACLLKIGEVSLIPGEDFVIDPSSGSSKGAFSVLPFALGDSLNKPIDKNIVFFLDVTRVIDLDSIGMYKQLKYSLAYYGPVIWRSNEKLNWSISDHSYKYPIINLKPEINLKPKEELIMDIRNKMVSNLTTQNVIAKVSGRKNKILAITAHYDHLGMMGDIMYPGANDNASGISLLLNLAKYYTDKKNKYTMLFMCFGAEEIGLLGSKYFTQYPNVKLKRIKFLVNLDLVGTGEDGIAIVNALEQKKYVKRITKINSENHDFKRVKIRGQAPNSDHYWFAKNDVPSIFIYTLGGVAHYHNPLDKSETLPLTKTDKIQDLLINFFDSF